MKKKQKNNPIKVTRRAGKRVGKALGSFEKAAYELEKASAEHLSAVDKLDAEIDVRFNAAHTVLADSVAAAQAEAHRRTQDLLAWVDSEQVRIEAIFMDEIDKVETLALLAEATEEEAFNAQYAADNLRKLVAVA